MTFNMDRYEKMLDEFLEQCPNWEGRIVEYCPKNSWTIRVTRDDGVRFDYNSRQQSIRVVKHVIDERIDIEDLSEANVRSVFASNLSEIMRAKGFGQARLAECTGLTSAAISKYLHKESTPTLSSVLKIARALNCAPEDLMD